ncbi:Sortilin-related receptor [Portunus trituberculatus]|uniref:Sortilin-related receptor n=1 Tax=Portunus trituberculatus TaxID=210409 RepID=A0A5B7CSV3_PORTR|nr:Sortilin-related receptor [Portunus trituberculatus]
MWGRTINELKHSAHMANTTNTTFIIRGLDACEVYRVAVMVEQPFGLGPREETQVSMGADAKAPPRNIQASLNNITMTITWKDSCPHDSSDDQKYRLFVTETNRNVTSSYQLLSQKNLTRSHYIQIHWGGRYSIQMSTAANNAVLSDPVICNGPEIPPPFELTYMDSSFFWRDSPNLPKEITSKNYTYILHLSHNLNMSDAEVYECTKPPLVVETLEKGKVYYAAVALKDADGYLSQWSHHLSIEKPLDDELVLSQTNAVGVGVSVFLVVVALLVVVGILAVRHRRLARSIIAFTNTHYDSSQGTTLITTDHNLDEDDDSPMIRGFSDDEPLVIA